MVEWAQLGRSQTKLSSRGMNEKTEGGSRSTGATRCTAVSKKKKTLIENQTYFACAFSHNVKNRKYSEFTQNVIKKNTFNECTLSLNG